MVLFFFNKIIQFSNLFYKTTVTRLTGHIIVRNYTNLPPRYLRNLKDGLNFSQINLPLVIHLTPFKGHYNSKKKKNDTEIELLMLC